MLFDPCKQGALPVAKTALTDLAIRTATPEPGRQYNLWDDRVAGFGLRISPGGTKTFFLQYRYKRHERTASLGKYPTLTLAQARDRAQVILGQVKQGVDPKYSDPVLSRKPTFGSVLEDFIEKYVKVKNKPSTQREHERLLRKEFLPRWQHREITDIKKLDVLAILDDILVNSGPGAANHAYANINKLFNWALQRDIIPYSPCHGLSKPADTKECDNVLSHQELAGVWHASLSIGYPFGSIAQLLMLTGQRRSEVTQMRWQDIDFDETYWLIPREFTKNNRPHLVPLVPTALELLAHVPRINEIYLFPSRRTPTRCFSGFSKSKSRLDALAKVDGWTLHDLRRTVSTNMARLGVLQEFIDRTLNQITGSSTKVSRVYNRYDYLNEKTDALTRWTNYLFQVIGC